MSKRKEEGRPPLTMVGPFGAVGPFVSTMESPRHLWDVDKHEKGFEVSEVPEYIGRKMMAIFMIIFGVILMVVGFMAGIAVDSFGIILVSFLLGLIVTLYGLHYWSKVTHIMWTRQALREYGVPSRGHYLRYIMQVSRKLDQVLERLSKIEEALINNEGGGEASGA